MIKSQLDFDWMNGEIVLVRKLQRADLNRVAEIWLDTNINAHNFIAAQYWQNHFKAVKQMFLQAEVYVYEDENKNRIEGFIGLMDDHIAGIFVWKEAQSLGIGKHLLDCAKSIKKQLNLRVYQRNIRAVKFYQREDFKIQSEDIDADTGEKEYFMVWKRL